MIDLIRYECWKILGKKTVLIGLALLAFFNVMLYKSYSLPNMRVFPDENSEYIKGLEAVTIDKAITQKYTGILTDEKVQEMLQDFAPTPAMMQRFKGLNVAAIPMNSMQVAVQNRFANPDGSWNGLTVHDIYGDSKIQVGYNTGWLNTSFYMIQVIIGIGFLLIVAVSPVFSGEYSGMDALILTSRNGKTKCVTAKLIAAFLATFLITAMFLILNIGIAIMSFGTDGLNASISFAASNYFDTLPYDMSCKTLIIYQTILAFTSVFGATALTLAVSSMSKNTFIALAAAAVIHIIPFTLPVSEFTPLYKYMLLFPIYQGQLIFILSLDKIALFGNSTMYAVIVIPVITIVCILGCMICKRVFSRHQII
jgi:hypothetical protein